MSDSKQNQKLINKPRDGDNIIENIIKLMEQAESVINLSGSEKKMYVLDTLKILIGEEMYDRYFYLITSFIDFTTEISKGRKIDINNIKKKFNCCI